MRALARLIGPLVVGAVAIGPVASACTRYERLPQTLLQLSGKCVLMY